jgi:hypothetical protein
MERPTVSIITPAYNAEPYLTETVESALGQTFRDFEMLIVDDGSTDRTAAIAAGLCRRDSRIRLLRQPNQGISGARNRALEESRGTVLALLDSDDRWFPTYLEEQLRILNTRPTAGVVSANALNLGGPFDGQPLRAVPPGIHRISLRSIIEIEDAVCIMSVFRREVCDRIGGFDRTLVSSEDYDFWLRAATAGFDILFNATPLGWYRRRDQSVSADEARMLVSVADVLRRTKAALPPGCHAEAAAIDAQLDRFKWELIGNTAKQALHRGDFAAAADCFARMAEHRGSLRLRVAAGLARYAPGLLRLAHQTTLSVRRLHTDWVRPARRPARPMTDKPCRMSS